MKLVIFKHGKTNYNLAGKRQGRTDLRLNDVGRAQIIELKNKINHTFDAVIASPMNRTLETAAILFPNTKIITNDLLLEFDFGELEGEPFSKHPDQFPDNETAVYNEIEFVLPNEGESFEEIVSRCHRFIKYLVAHYRNDHTIAVITHSTNMEILTALIEKKPWHTYLGQAKTFHGMTEVELRV